MANQQLIRKLADSEEVIVPTLFKPVQFNIIKKLNAGKKLTENEKRYLRGNMRKKLNMLWELEEKEAATDSINILLSSISSYYVTGLEALRHNGYGWYFEPKIIEIINTKIEGNIRMTDKILKFIRVKSIENSSYAVDEKKGLKYATNEQIIKDTGMTKNEYTKNVWMQMLSRYKSMFVKNYSKFRHLVPKEKTINYAEFGV